MGGKTIKKSREFALWWGTTKKGMSRGNHRTLLTQKTSTSMCSRKWKNRNLVLTYGKAVKREILILQRRYLQ